MVTNTREVSHFCCRSMLLAHNKLFPVLGFSWPETFGPMSRGSILTSLWLIYFGLLEMFLCETKKVRKHPKRLTVIFQSVIISHRDKKAEGANECDAIPLAITVIYFYFLFYFLCLSTSSKALRCI